MDIFTKDDPFYNLTYDKAVAMRRQYESIVEQNKASMERIQNRRKRICKKLDKEIEDCRERVRNAEAVLEALERLYFKEEEWSELK
jgi:DNA-binding transcriptional regulator YhcF (GntR family)